jgi:glycosyltransferase involved in cell wall biosynthesis
VSAIRGPSATEGAGPDLLSLTVGVATFRRPTDLGRVLPLLVTQAEDAARRGLVSRATVLVVDNDPEASARTTVDSLRSGVSYVVEPRAGVAAARNRILDEARTDLLVFIDDDETPEGDEWLSSLLDARTRYAADGVAGPVRTVIAGELDPWIVAGQFFRRGHRTTLRTGTPIERAATNNLLLDLRFVRRAGVRFDDDFGRSGGEDSLFSAQLRTAGARLIWTADAAVLDHLPPERQTRAYALSRTHAMASAGVRVNVALRTTPSGRLAARGRGLLIGTARMLLGGGRIAAGAVLGSVGLDAVGRRELHRGMGAISGSLGRRTLHYGGE